MALSANEHAHREAATPQQDKRRILSNGIVTGRAYDPNTGALQGEASGVGSNPAVANRAYTWDADGNLSTRQDNVKGLTETFTYDNLNRVKTAAVSGGSANSTLTMGYDLVGNITSKTSPGTGADMGAYTYDATHPMEIASITSSGNVVRNFQYDNSNGAAGNGNLVNDGIRTYTWDAENRPIQITNTQTSVTTNFSYSPDGMRYAESTTGSDPSSLTEVNGLFQAYTEGGHTSYRNSIAAPTGIVAIYTVRDDSLVTTRYLTADHLGSSSEITNEVGVVTEAMSYDVFGAKRDPNTWQTYAFGAAPGTTDVTDKGYTGQQQLDALGLIHMNGRVQDPYTGRFVSADPTVPDPFYSQAFNRFAYAYNNPMNSTDPSGYCTHTGDPLSMADCTDYLPPSGQPIGLCFGNAPCPGTTTNESPTQKVDPQAQRTIQLGKITVTGSMSGRNQPGIDDGTVGPNQECISGDCQGPDPDNNPRNQMDSTDGATTWNGTFSNDDAGPPLGFLGQKPMPPVQVKVIALPGIAGGGGPKVAPHQRVPGSLGLTAPDAADSDVDKLFEQAHRTYLQAKHESNVERAVLNNQAMLSGSTSDQFFRNFQRESENSGLISASLVVNGSVELSEMGDEVGLKAAGDLAKSSARNASSEAAASTFVRLGVVVEGAEFVILAPKIFGLGVDISNAVKAVFDTASGH